MGDKTYESKKAQILNDVRENKEVGLDSNIIVAAAQRNDGAFLKQLKNYARFKVAIEIFHELIGLSFNSKFDSQTKSILKEFCKGLEGRTYVRRSEEVVKRLYKFVPLLPRRIATYAVIKFVDRLIQKYCELEKQPLSQQVLLAISRSYLEGVSSIKVDCEEKYLELMDELNLPAPDEKAYFEEVEKNINLQLKEIQVMLATLRENKGNISIISAKLKEFKQKTYDADVKHAAGAIEQGTQGHSMDSDVLWLFTFHGLRPR
jgi:hypothetical protein